jgi:hypothetical protein
MLILARPGLEPAHAAAVPTTSIIQPGCDYQLAEITPRAAASVLS